jgi:hypothetical protein
VLDVFLRTNQPWTAELALERLSPTAGPRVEIIRGSIVVTPHAGADHQTVELELGWRLKRAARTADLWSYHEINVVSGDDLYIPDLVVLRASAAGRSAVPIGDAVLLGEIVFPGDRRKDVVDRPREYAAAGVPYFLRVEFRNRVPALVLHELADGEYRPLAAAAAGSTFAMREPFVFEVDPAELLDPEE